MPIQYDLQQLSMNPVAPKHVQARVDVFMSGNGTPYNSSSTTNASPSTLLYMPFVFHSSEWGNTNFVAEYAAYVNNASYGGYIGIWDATASAVVSGSEVGTSSTTTVALRSGTFALTDGHTYSFYTRVSNSSAILYLASVDVVALI